MLSLFSPGASVGRTRRRETPVASDRAKLIATVIALCFASPVLARPSFLPAPSFSAPHPAVVRVTVPEQDGTAYGSGALVEVNETFGLVVTNWHVVREASGVIGVFFPDGFRSAATVLRADRDWDLAALVIWRPNARPIAVSNQAPRPGELLTIAGYGSGSYRAVSGRCTQYVSPGGNQPFEMVELAAPAREGDSGGPILNDRGELAGVLFGSAFGRTTGSHCGRLREFLDSAAGDFQRLSSRQMLARRPAREQAPLASIAGVREEAANDPVTTPAGKPSASVPAIQPSPVPTMPVLTLPAAVDSERASAAASPAAAVPTAGPLPATEQIKTILAAIGLIAVVYCALRLLGWAVG